MQIRWSSLSPSAQTSLLEIVTLVLDSCNEQSFSNILWCITEMEIPVLLKSASESATRPFSNSTLLSVDKNLLAELESKLSTNLVRLSNNFTGLGISTILYSLAKNHKYQQLPKEVCTTLEMRLVSFYEGASSYRVAGEVSNIIYALGKLEAKFDLLPVPVQMVLSKVVYDTCGKMNEQQIG